jgi:hypothetical protein
LPVVLYPSYLKMLVSAKIGWALGKALNKSRWLY